MDAERLAEAGVRFFAVFDGNDAVAMGALKPLTGSKGELKSMHVHPAFRGKGFADAILERLLDEARAAGMTRVSLETGSQDAFAPARAFYLRHGFSACPPFEGYSEDPNSVFLSRPISIAFNDQSFDRSARKRATNSVFSSDA